MSEPVKLAQPETERQARTWQAMNNHAVQLGLCFSCAAQYAYGRVHGWLQVKPPCAGCMDMAHGRCVAWPLAFAGTRVSAVHSPAPTRLPAMPATGTGARSGARTESAAA